MPPSPTADAAVVRELAAAYERLSDQIGKVIVGQRTVVEQLLTSLFSRGHCLLVGVPGLAKTLLVSTVAKVLALSFKRVQFTPDLMPADITGTDILQDDPETGRRRYVFLPGPLFANMILADEINRTPPKTQAALLEAMQEGHVTAGGQTYKLPAPFFVLATQNPIEQEGTYPLPEAQLDRFMLKLKVDYPSRDEEREMLVRMTAGRLPGVKPVANADDVSRARVTAQRVFVDQKIHEYVLDLVRASRRPREHGLGDLGNLIEYGASPRAAINLVQAARAHAFLRHRPFVAPDDVKAIAPDVLRHRVTLTYAAEADGIASDTLVSRILEHVPVP